MKKGYITYSEAFKMKVVEDDRARQICHDSAGAESLRHLRDEHDPEMGQKIRQARTAAETGEGGNDDRNRRA